MSAQIICNNSCFQNLKPSSKAVPGRCNARNADRERADRARDDQLRRQRALAKLSDPKILPDKGYFKEADPKGPFLGFSEHVVNQDVM